MNDGCKQVWMQRYWDFQDQNDLTSKREMPRGKTPHTKNVRTINYSYQSNLVDYEISIKLSIIMRYGIELMRSYNPVIKMN